MECGILAKKLQAYVFKTTAPMKSFICGSETITCGALPLHGHRLLQNMGIGPVYFRNWAIRHGLMPEKIMCMLLMIISIFIPG
jgi:hypothetical protein